jgi:hypothetical protein
VLEAFQILYYFEGRDLTDLHEDDSANQVISAILNLFKGGEI